MTRPGPPAKHVDNARLQLLVFGDEGSDDYRLAAAHVETDDEMPFQAAAGLAAAYEQGVIHRDVKPANILLENGVERTLLTDFGLARTVDDASLTHTGIVAGTPHYMSPEQANAESTDHRSDLFSLGSVLYFMATGRPPFRAERAMGVLKRICHDRHRPVWEVNADLPDQLGAIIDRLLQKKPRHRFAGAAEVKQRLTAALAEIQQRTGRRSRLRRFAKRYRRIVVCIAVLLALFGGLGLAVIGGSFGSSGTTEREANGDASPVRCQAEAERAARLSSDSSGLSVEVIRQASASEASDFAAELKAIQSRIRWLEGTAGDVTFDASPDSSWEDRVRSIHSRLDRLQSAEHP